MRRLHPAITIVALATLAFLYAPMIAVAIFSLNDAWRGFVWRGFTLKWYVRLLDEPAVLRAAWHSLLLAAVSTIIATIVGTLLALGMQRFPWRRRAAAAIDLTVHLPVVTPDIILAAALVVALGLLRHVSTWFDPGLVAMVLGHVTFQIPFVALVVRSRLATLGGQVEEAGRDLYASTGRLMARVTLPLLAPAILAAAMLAFTLSLDDFVISFFTSSAQSVTLPLYIYGELRKGITASTHALSTLIFLITVLLVFSIERLTRSRKVAP